MCFFYVMLFCINLRIIKNHQLEKKKKKKKKKNGMFTERWFKNYKILSKKWKTFDCP